MKKLLLSLMFISGLAQADNEMAYTQNKLGGQIFFTIPVFIFFPVFDRL